MSTPGTGLGFACSALYPISEPFNPSDTSFKVVSPKHYLITFTLSVLEEALGLGLLHVAV